MAFNLLFFTITIVICVQLICSMSNPSVAQQAANDSESSSLLYRLDELIATDARNRTDEDASTMKKYVSSVSNLTINYPEQWIPSTYGLRHYSDLVAFYSPLENLTDLFPVKVTVSMLKFKQNISLGQYTNSTLAAFDASDQIEIKGSNPFTLSTYPGYGAVLDYVDPQNGNITYTTVNLWTSVKQAVYALTYEGETSKIKLHLPEFARMSDSFHIGGHE